MLILKIIILWQILIANKIFVINEINNIKDNDKSIEKYKKLSKTEKLSKSQKSAKLRKKLLKNLNLPNFNKEKNSLNFLISKIKTAFNYLWLSFIETLNFWHFDPEYHIWIKIDISSYIIEKMLS